MKQRVNTLLEPETIEALNKEAKEKSISVSAVIRQKVEQSYKDSTAHSLFWPISETKLNEGNNMLPDHNIPSSELQASNAKPCDHVFNRAKGVTYTKCFKCGGEI